MLLGQKNNQGIYLPSSVTCCCSNSSKSWSWKFSNGFSSTYHEQAKQHKYIQANDRNKLNSSPINIEKQRQKA